MRRDGGPTALVPATNSSGKRLILDNAAGHVEKASVHDKELFFEQRNEGTQCRSSQDVGWIQKRWGS